MQTMIRVIIFVILSEIFILYYTELPVGITDANQSTTNKSIFFVDACLAISFLPIFLCYSADVLPWNLRLL